MVPTDLNIGDSPGFGGLDFFGPKLQPWNMGVSKNIGTPKMDGL